MALTSPHLDGLLNFGRSLERWPPPDDLPDAKWCGAIHFAGNTHHIFTFEGFGSRFLLVTRDRLERRGFTADLEGARKSTVDWICQAAQIVDFALSCEPTPTGAE